MLLITQKNYKKARYKNYMKNQSLRSTLASRMLLIAGNSQQRVLASSGRHSRDIENADEYLIFYSLFPEAGSYSMRTIVTPKSMDHRGFVEYFANNGWELVRYGSRFNPHKNQEYSTYELWAHPSGILVRMEIDFGGKSSDVGARYRTLKHYLGGIEIEKIPEKEDENEKNTCVDRVDFIAPMNSTAAVEEQWTNLKEVSRNCKIVEDNEARLGMISSDGGSYYVKHFNMKSRVSEFTYPDLHYGENFEEFHQSLLQRINEESKGLILLHGNPGTGKTQYIRVLLELVAKM